jgi:nucleotide-binding universal stress UspA family protein
MIRIQRILVPVDFSPCSKRAIHYGISLALEFNARLVLAHITAFDKQQYEDAKSRLLTLIPPEFREGLHSEIIVKAGDVHNELQGIVEDRDIDLVIMGSHGRSYFGRLVLGSLTERMLRQLRVPVLTVSHLSPDKEIHGPEPVPLRRILFATDLSEDADKGLEFAVRLAKGLNAALTVLHVLAAGEQVFVGTEMTAFPAAYSAELWSQTEERLRRSVARVADGSIPITTLVMEGTPAEKINQVVAESNIDLVVLNLQKKGRLERAVLGTTAERLIRSATVPVLSVPLPITYESRWAAA